MARRELKMALSLKDIKFLKDVPPELLKDFKAMAAKQDTNFMRTTVQDKMESMFRKLKDNDYLGVDETTFSVCEDIEEINLVSTKFPKPVLNPDGLYNTPEEVDEQEIIALNKESIYQLIEDDLLVEVPKNRAEMLKCVYVEQLTEAEHKEMFDLTRNGTFEIKVCPKGRVPIPCRWVYDLKRNVKNQIERFKARLVVQGFRQVEGIDFQKTFSSVAQMRTFRTMVALAVRFNLNITQYDISSAFLNADIDTELYMKFPPGYPPKDESQHYVFQLLKGLYGLKQASRLWRELIVKVFGEANLEVCKTEPGILCIKLGDLCLICLFVDDYLLLTNNEELRTKIEDIMANLFEVKPLGKLGLYLGVVVEWYKLPDGRRAVKQHQGPYFERFFKKVGYDKAKSAKSPAMSTVKLSSADSPTENEEKPDWPYMSVGGSIMYPSLCCRPDITYQINRLARFNKNPGKAHVDAQKHLIRYLKGTKDRGLIYKEPTEMIDNKVKIIACVDTDWAGCQDTRRSTVGYVVYLDGCPIAWKSKLMSTLALSSCEAEFMGLSFVAREVMWLCRFLTEIGVEYEIPQIFCDSQSAIYWAEDPVQHQRNKHVELKYYYIRDLVGAELVQVWKINGKFNPADGLTKPADQRMMEDIVPPLMGEQDIVFEE